LGVDLPHGVDDSAREKVANWGLPAVRGEWFDLENIVHGYADRPILVIDEHDRTVRERRVAEKARDEVDDGDDRSTDVDESPDVRGRPGETRRGRRRKDLPHGLQLDPTDTIRQLEEEQLAGRYVRSSVR